MSKAPSWKVLACRCREYPGNALGFSLRFGLLLFQLLKAVIYNKHTVQVSTRIFTGYLAALASASALAPATVYSVTLSAKRHSGPHVRCRQSCL